MLSHCTVFGSLHLHLVSFTGLLRGTLFPFLTSTAKSLILTGKLCTVFFTLWSALCPLVCQSLCLVFVVLLLSPLSICFFPIPLLRVFYVGFSPSCSLFPPMCPVIQCCQVLFGFNLDELRATPRVFVYLLNVCKFVIWHSWNDFRFHGVSPGATSAVIKVRLE